MVMREKKPEEIGKSKIKLIEKNYDWGLYFWEKPNGKVFGDGHGNLLNIPARKGDLEKIMELRKAAEYWGQPEGKPVFHPGVNRVSEMEYSEQIARMKEGLIPNMNDLGAVHAAQQTIREHGSDD